MKTVKEVSELTGISIRTLRYYDEIDLLKPAKVTEAGYRLYDESSLKKLRQIMFFRELEVPLSEIKAIMKDSESDNRKILETQKMMLEMKRNRLNGIIELISDVLKGEDKMSFETFNEDDIQKIIQHSLKIMSKEDKKIIIEHYGDIEKFKESVAEGFKDEKECEHLIKIYGSKEKREKLLKNYKDYDVILTTYGTYKNDMDNYKNLKFDYLIIDEAQNIKNPDSVITHAIKNINAKSKFALTGTPIENSLAELWSIFDFIMPGYLFSYKKFKTEYETPIVRENDARAMKKLKMLIEPFVLRRTKKQVLTELPEKTITVLNNQMKDEQEKIYLTYLAQAKQEVAETIQMNGIERSHIQVLAALTRLRQICCHPSLFIKDYKDGSSKLDQCMEIINDAVESGHKILLFSGYTSMFDLIEKEFEKNNIKYFKLTGATKVDERIKMVDEFNENKDIKVFLISLKAGGTGLNLTGADMVIHYDPWWNASAENQATDRAYRIGQKNNVQVYKLITKNSIEEKIYELQQKKSQLIDNMLDTKTSFISKLSKEDIMKLFE